MYIVWAIFKRFLWFKKQVRIIIINKYYTKSYQAAHKINNFITDFVMYTCSVYLQINFTISVLEANIYVHLHIIVIIIIWMNYT